MDYNPLPLLALIVYLLTGLVDTAVALPSRLGEAAVLGVPILLDPVYRKKLSQLKLQKSNKYPTCVQLPSLSPPRDTASTALGTWSSKN